MGTPYHFTIKDPPPPHLEENIVAVDTLEFYLW